MKKTFRRQSEGFLFRASRPFTGGTTFRHEQKKEEQAAGKKQIRFIRPACRLN